jgi:hypothetical protein
LLVGCHSSVPRVHSAGLTTAHSGERAARVLDFDNLGDDSSPDIRKTPSPK